MALKWVYGFDKIIDVQMYLDQNQFIFHLRWPQLNNVGCLKEGLQSFVKASHFQVLNYPY
jgi:hypothetical protein